MRRSPGLFGKVSNSASRGVENSSTIYPNFEYIPIIMIHDDPLLTVSEFVKKHAADEKVAVIFDLDSTLFEVSSRTQAILQRLGEHSEFKSKFETASETLRTIEVLPTDWGIKSLLTRYQSLASSELISHVRDFWRRHFFSSHFLDQDEMHPYANEYVRHLAELGAEIYYLTGRPAGSMRPGTVAALKNHGFPLSSEAHLLMKPTEVETDEHFKTVVLKELAPRFNHVWFFENEPVIIDEVRAVLPQIKFVFVDTIHSGKAQAPTDLPTIGRTFDGSWRPK